MSLFLVYFEPTFTPLKATTGLLRSSQTTVIVEGSQKPITYAALVITDGHSSERFLTEANANGPGEALRTALTSYVQERIKAGARPRLLRTTFRGPIEPVKIRGERNEAVTVSQLETRLLSLTELVVLEVKPDKAPSDLDLTLDSIGRLLPDDLILNEMRGILEDGRQEGSETVLRVGPNEISVPKDVNMVVVSKAVVKEHQAVATAPLRVRVAIGGLIVNRNGAPGAKYCFATLGLNSERHVIFVEFKQ